MGLAVECRSSDSPYIEQVWRSSSGDAGRLLSVAIANAELVFWEHRGRIEAAVRGPETRVSHAPVPAGATFFGITFAVGASMPHLPVRRLVDGEVDIPDVTPRSFRLKGSVWRRPDYDNAEEFVRRLVREDVLDADPVVAAVLRGEPAKVSERTVQRRFLAATGLTRDAVRQIGRARRAAVLIRDGVPARDVVHRLGYFDQPHLARSLTRYIGRTATRLTDPDPAEPLSLLYKT
ncbi:MAG: helix-turn-helix domain-containing protein [Streptosporangiales bacterium]|nr:helix-turn-helix domain-containing protein [Streptosporangiales bacterium]